MKKILSLILAVLLLVSLVGCASGNEPAQPAQQTGISQAELDAVKAELAAKEAQIAELKAQLDQPDAIGVYALHATIDGQDVVAINGETELTAQALLDEGQVVDHWELSGEIMEASDETFTFTASGETIVEAVLRAEKKVTTINCKIRFLNDKGEAAGDSYEEFVFEKPYQNPVTNEEIADGTITMQVKAEIPSGYMVDYWIINGVKYDYSNTVNSFIVEGLNEATEYEVVLKEIYYKVTCYGCTVNGKTELWVRPGTKLTAVANGGYYAEFYINDVQMNSKWRDPYVKQWTFTVKGDTHVEAYAIIN